MKLSAAIALFAAGVAARSLVSLCEHRQERVREFVNTTSQVCEAEYVEGIQIYDFRSRLSGTNVLFELSWIIYDDVHQPLDPNDVKLRTRLVSCDCVGEFSDVKERSRERTGERTF